MITATPAGRQLSRTNQPAQAPLPRLKEEPRTEMNYLYQALDSLRAVLPAEIWDHDWREHHARLAHPEGGAFTPAEWTDALHAVAPADRATIDALLRRGFDS